ncbi:MAG: DUF4855 domain-containing protein [Muribaculaceae bacterium]|nr:DUF4855 domain-containing protein [Muribaculaceae bacterium]
MKLRILTLITLLAGVASAALGARPVNKFGVDTEVCDPVLIYTGGLAKRALWTEQNLRPYLTHLYADGTRDWLYDAFIFNETNWTTRTASGKTETRVLINASGGQLPATKAEWDAYFDHIFSPEHDIAALDRAIDSYREELGEPRLRHKVIIGIPFPCKDGRGTPTACEWKKFDFGTINDTDMDFSQPDHRIEASKWAVDEVIRRFGEAGYRNLDLAGIYCAEETLWSVKDFIKTVNLYIRSKGLRTYWIPYWGTGNDVYAHEWKNYAFDMVYRQPNYFFYKNGTLPEKTQLTDCITMSKRYGLGLELEFETSGTSNGLHNVAPHMHQRLIDYLDAFEEKLVWETSGVAHYSGSKGMLDMLNSNDPVNQATMDRLAELVRKRQTAFAEQSGIDAPEAAPEAPFAYPGKGEIFISNAPEAVVYSITGAVVHSGEGRFSCPAGIYIATDGKNRAVKIAVK